MADAATKRAQAALRQRRYKARKSGKLVELPAPAAGTVQPRTPAPTPSRAASDVAGARAKPGEVEQAVRAELKLLGPAVARVPGQAATAVALARMMDHPEQASSAVAGQIRLLLGEIRSAAGGGAGTGRLANLRQGVAELKRGG